MKINTSVVILDVLIPTYNRALYLEKNIDTINIVLHEINVQSLVRLIVVDNCSTDTTSDVVAKAQARYSQPEIRYHRNKSNIGLEANIVKCLKLASASYVMYHGDDDYLSVSYWKAVMKVLTEESTVGVIIPERRSIRTTADIHICLDNVPVRIRAYKPGWVSCWKLAPKCNQLSGLVFAREMIYPRWIERGYRSMYMFMTFAGWCALSNQSYQIHGSPVLITEGVKKDWGYGSDGLLLEILSNAYYITGGNTLQRIIGELILIWCWRDRMSMYWVMSNQSGWGCQAQIVSNRSLMLSTRICAFAISQLVRLKIKIWRSMGRLCSIHDPASDRLRNNTLK